MKKTELKEMVINKIKDARSINNLIDILGLKSGGGIINAIKKIIIEEQIDISHFGGKIIRQKKYNEIVKKCPICNKAFFAREGHKKEQIYCSRSCSNTDRIHSEETIEKITKGNQKTSKKFISLPEKYGEEAIDVAKKMKLNGKTYGEIKEVTKITDDDLKKILKSNNLIFQSNSVNARLLKKEDVLILYLENKSIEKVSKILGVSRTTIRKFINDDELIAKATKSKSKCVTDWRKRKKMELVSYKGGKCESCGYNNSISVLSFHHLNPKEKDFTISGKSYSFERLKNEVDKCIMLCSNCHIEVHEEIKITGYSEKINKIMKNK